MWLLENVLWIIELPRLLLVAPVQSRAAVVRGLFLHVVPLCGTHERMGSCEIAQFGWRQHETARPTFDQAPDWALASHGWDATSEV